MAGFIWFTSVNEQIVCIHFGTTINMNECWQFTDCAIKAADWQSGLFFSLLLSSSSSWSYQELQALVTTRAFTSFPDILYLPVSEQHWGVITPESGTWNYSAAFVKYLV